MRKVLLLSVLTLLIPVIGMGKTAGTYELCVIKIKGNQNRLSPFIEDQHVRGFDKLQPIVFDIDGDNRVDEITPRVIDEVKSTNAPNKSITKNWIIFDLKTGNGRSVKSFFKYEFGADGVEYWVWALRPCRVNNDRYLDLVYYAGDDTTEEESSF